MAIFNLIHGLPWALFDPRYSVNRLPKKENSILMYVWPKHSNRANRSFFVHVCQNRKLKVTERENQLTRQAALTLTAIFSLR